MASMTCVNGRRVASPNVRQQGWTRVRAAAGVEGSPDSLPQSLLGWVLGCLLVYSALFGAGAFLYGATLNGWVAVAVFAALAIPRILSRSKRIVPRSGNA